MTRKHRWKKSYRGQIMDDYTRLLNESLKDPEFKRNGMLLNLNIRR